MSRKYPFLYGPTILTMSACYETAIHSCCQEENKTECFQMKVKYSYVNCYLEPCSAVCGLCTSNVRITWRLIGNAESEALLQTYEIRLHCKEILKQFILLLKFEKCELA